MEMAKGRAYTNGALPEFDESSRRHMYEQLVDTLSDLHNIDPGAAGLGDFGKRQPQIEVEDHGGSMLRLQAPEAALELVAVCHRSGRIVHGRFGPDDLDLCRPPSSMTALIGACIDEQPTKPCIESLRVTQARQFTPGVDECLLHGILREMGVAEDQPGDREEPVRGTDRERFERVVITALGRLDEASIHSGTSGRRPIWSPEPYDAAICGRVQEWVTKIWPPGARR